jgi:hypothetical protein
VRRFCPGFLVDGVLIVTALVGAVLIAATLILRLLPALAIGVLILVRRGRGSGFVRAGFQSSALP